MNHVDALLRHPFHRLTQEEKLEIKRLGPHQPIDFQLKQSDSKQNRRFSKRWFEDYEWLTISEASSSFFCFYCLLFSNSDCTATWSKYGYSDLKHITDKLKKHNSSINHINSAVKYKTFGTTNVLENIDTGHKLAVQRHNQEVEKNRHILNRIIDCIKFCGVHELPLRGHDETNLSFNRGVFQDLVDLLSELDDKLSHHLQTSTVTRYTSNTIQNEILQCILEVYLNDLKFTLSNSPFCAVLADETTDISCISQFAITLRFIGAENKPVEKFYKFVDVNDRTASGLSNILVNELNAIGGPNISEKLIAQTYDGAAVMSGSSNGVQALLKQSFPYAHYIHCYAHQANLILRKLTVHISKVRLFFANISGFSSFFSVSPKRSDELRSVTSKRLPRPGETRWNFQSRLVGSVFEVKESLIECFSNIIEKSDVWDGVSVREAFGLRRLLEDEEFLYFLNFFNILLSHVDVLFNTFQSRTTSGVEASSVITDFKLTLGKIRQDIILQKETDQESRDTSPTRNSAKRRRTNQPSLASAAIEVCDTLESQLSDKLDNSELIAAFCVVDPKRFEEFSHVFPTAHVNTFKRCFPFLEELKLSTELRVLYSNETFRAERASNASSLYRYVLECGLASTFPQAVQVLQIVLCTPVSSAEPERCFSTLKRIKTSFRNSMGQTRLNSLAVLSIHKEDIKKAAHFNQDVIERFASMKNRRASFLYK